MLMACTNMKALIQILNGTVHLREREAEIHVRVSELLVLYTSVGPDHGPKK